MSYQLSEVSQENAMLKGKILTLNETLNNTELETKASRETIMRLVSEVGKEQRDFERMQKETDACRSVGFLLLSSNMRFNVSCFWWCRFCPAHHLVTLLKVLADLVAKFSCHQNVLKLIYFQQNQFVNVLLQVICFSENSVNISFWKKQRITWSLFYYTPRHSGYVIPFSVCLSICMSCLQLVCPISNKGYLWRPRTLMLAILLQELTALNISERMFFGQ